MEVNPIIYLDIDLRSQHPAHAGVDNYGGVGREKEEEVFILGILGNFSQKSQNQVCWNFISWNLHTAYKLILCFPIHKLRHFQAQIGV